MPFTPERPHLIQTRINDKLSTSRLDDWQRSFLTNMQNAFAKYGPKTRLTAAQYRKLHELLDLARDASPSSAKSTVIQPARAAQKTACKARLKPISPLRLIHVPRQVGRRLQRELFLPFLLTTGLLVILGMVFDTTRVPLRGMAGQSLFASGWVVSGDNVNQRRGPGTDQAIIGVLS